MERDIRFDYISIENGKATSCNDAGKITENSTDATEHFLNNAYKYKFALKTLDDIYIYRLSKKYK